MKSILNSNFILIALIALISCGPATSPEPDESVADTVTVAQHSPTISISAQGAPLSNSEYQILRYSGQMAFGKNIADNPGNFGFPPRIEPLINLGDFHRFVNDTEFEGIRIYPAINDLMHLFMIICHANRTTKTEGEYYVLREMDYTNPSSFPPSPSSFEEAQNLHMAYMQNIRLFHNNQEDAESPLFGRLRYSRFYLKEEILSFISDNLDDEEPSHDGFTVGLEFGYIPDEFVDKLQGRFDDDHYTDDEMQGYTIMMHLKDPEGNRRIDTRAIYDPESYKGRYLEVGLPCPPRCGTLHER